MTSRFIKAAAMSGLIGVCLGATSVVAATRYASHPALYKARHQLMSARALLQHATHDCGGHRAIAVQKISDALNEVQTAIIYADAHPQEDSKH